MRFRSVVSAALLAAAVALPAGAQQILNVDATYLGSTSLLAINAALPVFGDFTSVTNGSITATFDNAQNKRQIGFGWATWASGQPNSEWDGSSPFYVGYTNGAQSVGISFNSLITLFGFEAEPDSFGIYDFTVDYYNGASLVGSIARTIDGNAGSRLLAYQNLGGFDRVVVTTTDFDFAAGQYRVGSAATTAPEPASMALVATGLGFVGFVARRRRQRA